MLVADQLIHQACQLGAGLALHLKHRVGVGRNKARHKNRQRRQRHDHQRDAPFNEQHHAQRTADGQDAGKQLGESQQQAVAELLHVGGDAANGIAGAVGVHIFQGQLFQLLKGAHTHIAHNVEGNTVVDHVHQPLRDSRAGYCARHGNGQLAHAAKVYLAGADNMVYRLAGDDRSQQGSDHSNHGQHQRQHHQPGIGADQLQHTAERALIHFLFPLAHKVFPTSSLLSWLRQISL